MNQKELNKILRSVKAGSKVKFNELRSAASAVGIKTKAGVKSDEIIDKLQSHIVTNGVGPGRPMAGACPIVGYKVKVGLRYPTDDGSMTTSMKEGKIFETPEAAQAAVESLVKTGTIREWGGTVRAQILPRYGKSE